MSATASACPSCGTKPSRENARFCDGCGSQITSPVASAEYKQVTVLFADVVRSMDLAATLDPERLRDIMSARVSQVGRGGAALRWHRRQVHR